jgi:hypothetical protein
MHSHESGAHRDPSRGGRHRSHRSRQRKERVLHTRISEQLAEDIRDMAEELRIPVSNLVRNVLEEAFAVVEQVSDNVGDLVEEVIEEAERARERLMRRSAHRRRHRSAESPIDESEPPVDAAELRGERSEQEAPSFPDVVGWQPLVLNRRRSCDGCGEALGAGEQAWVGVGEAGLLPHTLCADCLDALR